MGLQEEWEEYLGQVALGLQDNCHILFYRSLMKPEERVAAVDECVRDYLKMKNEDESRLRRVFKVLKRP